MQLPFLSLCWAKHCSDQFMKSVLPQMQELGTSHYLYFMGRNLDAGSSAWLPQITDSEGYSLVLKSDHRALELLRNCSQQYSVMFLITIVFLKAAVCRKNVHLVPYLGCSLDGVTICLGCGPFILFNSGVSL